MRVAEKELTDLEANDHFKLVAEYAREYGLVVALDLDVRHTRLAFEEKSANLTTFPEKTDTIQY